MYAGVPQGAILQPLFLIVYICNLSKDISSTVKHFLDDNSLLLFLMMLIMYVDVDDDNADVYFDNVDVFMVQLNHYMENISEWAYQ